MDTFFARNRLSAYLDGALPPAEAREVASAIERDPELAAEYEALRRTVALLQQEGPAKAPAGFHARVMGKLAEERPPAGNVVRLRRWVARLPVEAVALAAAAAVVVVAIQWQPDPTPEAMDGGERSAAASPEEAPGQQDGPPAAAQSGAPAEKNAEAPPAQQPAEKESAKKKATETDAGGDSPAVADGGPSPGSPKARPKTAPATQEYVPDWEAPETAAVAAVRGLRLVVTRPEVLHQLEQLARQSDGRLTDGQGRATRARTLSTEDPQATVMLVVPAHRASELESQLQGFGAQAGAAPSGLMVGNGNAAFYLDVRLELSPAP